MRRIAPDVFIPPMPTALLGVGGEDSVNFMAVGWLTRVNSKPPMLAVGVNKNHRTHELLLVAKAFGLSFPTVRQSGVVDYCGVVSGRRVDKSVLFDHFPGEVLGAPLIRECPLNLECRMRQAVELPTNTLFIAEIAAAWCDPACLEGDIPDPAKLEPLLLTMPDNRYWALGPQVGKAFHDGFAFKKTLDAASKGGNA